MSEDDNEIEAVAMAIAGSDWWQAFLKWEDQRRCFGADGLFRDVTHPSRDDYRNMARAAIKAVNTFRAAL